MRRVALLVLVLATACAGPSVLVVGESVRSPEPPPELLNVSVFAGDDGSPLAASVTFEEDTQLTDRNGVASAIWRDRPLTIRVEADGFHPGSQVVELLPEDGPIEIVLEPVVLTGTVKAMDGRPLPFSRVALGRASTVVDSHGGFELTRALPGELTVTRPAWEDAVIDWDGITQEIEIALEPKMVRGLRVGADKVGNPSEWATILELADNSAINALVIDTKDEGGTVFHDTGVRLAHEINAVQAFYDLDDVIADMDAHGLYKITRIVTFQDEPLASARPEIAATDRETGQPWENYKGLAWLDPTDDESWEYALALAEEACIAGFDEIQFDYVRFPSDGPISTLRFDADIPGDYYSPEAQELRVQTIARFLEAAHAVLNPLGCAVAADIFAITLESSTDEGIGQRPGPLSNHADVLSPMIYTYTYGPGWKGYADPNEHAVELVGGALDAGIPRIEGYSIYRPWIQRAFLEDEEILAVQDVAEERDLGWMLWSANTVYDAAFLPQE